MAERDDLSILHVLVPGGAGGLESAVRMLAASQASAGDEVRIATVVTDESAETYVRALAREGLWVREIRVSPRAYLAEWKRIGRLCRSRRPDVLHTHGYRADLVAGGAGRRLGIPTVTTVHGFTGGGLKNRLYERLQRRAFRRFDAVVAVSSPLAVELSRTGVESATLHVIRNAWRPGEAPLPPEHARRELGLPEQVFAVGWVGRLSREKGIDVFLQALARLGSFPAVASVVGDGPERRRQSERRSPGPTAPRVVWHGAIPGASRLFRAFDVFVLSSRTEGTPIVLFEAMQAEVPIVAVAVGGVPDVLSEREAILIPPEDPDALAEAIRRVRSDPEAARRRAKAARRRLETEFDPASWARRYEEVYRSVMASVSPREAART